MFGAIYVGLSGLNAYSRGLQQVSGNVSNLNSSGFKSSNVSFTDIVGAAANGGLSLSGSPASAGSGVELSGVQRDFAQGELRQTQRDLDLAVDGTGFLVLNRGDETFYTRTGSFEVDKDGFVVLAGTDYRLAMLDSAGRAVSMSIDGSRSSSPKPTTTVKFADNLSSTATSFGLSDIKVYDALGTMHLTLTIGRAALVRWRKSLQPPSGRPVLGRLQEALLSQSFALSLELGKGSLTLADLAALEVGDVVLLDRGVDAPVGLLVAGRDSGMKAALRPSQAQAMIEILEPKRVHK